MEKNEYEWYQNKIDELEAKVDLLLRQEKEVGSFPIMPMITTFRSNSGVKYLISDIYKIVEEYEKASERELVAHLC